MHTDPVPSTVRVPRLSRTRTLLMLSREFSQAVTREQVLGVLFRILQEHFAARGALLLQLRGAASAGIQTRLIGAFGFPEALLAPLQQDLSLQRLPAVERARREPERVLLLQPHEFFLCIPDAGPSLSEGGAELLALSSVQLERERDFVLVVALSRKDALTQKDSLTLRLLASEAIQALERSRLQKQNALLAAVVESSGDAMIAKDLNGEIISVNRAAERLLGFRKHELFGRPVSLLIPEERQTEELAARKRAERGENVVMETERLHRSGRRIPLSLTVSPVFDGAGRISGTSSFARDMTAQKRAQGIRSFLLMTSEVLNASLDYPRTLRQLADLLVPFLCDWCLVETLEEPSEPPSGTEPLRRLHRIAVACADPAKEPLARRLEQLMPDADADSGAPQALREGKVVTYPLLSHPRIATVLGDPQALGSRSAEQQSLQRQLGVSSFMTLLLRARDQELGAITLVCSSPERSFDAEDLELALEFARRASLAIQNALLYKKAQIAVQARDHFLSLASHELKTPLTSLYLQLQMAERKLLRQSLTEDHRESLLRMLRTAYTQVHRLNALNEDLIETIRLRAGKLRLSEEPTDLRELLREVLRRFEGALQDTGTRLSTDVPAPIVGIWDPGRLDQVLANLVSNVIKHAPGSHMEIRAHRRGDRAHLEIQDSGPGIPTEDLARLAAPFERASSTLPNAAGLGLGLFIARKIVEGHRGQLSIRSEIGKGTAVCVQLPLPSTSPQ